MSQGISKTLPKEVLECIITQIETMHLERSEACLSCYLGDLHSLSLVSRAWEKAARSRMYCKIFLLANEEYTKLPKLNIKGTSRLKLLRRTLREQPTLARCVRELHLSDIHRIYSEATIEREEIVNLVASLVMACPRLECVVGFHVAFSRSFDRLSHALSTRLHLKEKLWSIRDHLDDFSDYEDDSGAFYVAATDGTERFLELNSNHPTLTTLVLHSVERRTSAQNLGFRAIVGSIKQFPMLRHLTIAGLNANSFTNLALTALPNHLESLRLESLPGISDKGLQRFSALPLARSVESLTFVDLEISSMATISNILSPRFECLKKFSFAQHQAPNIFPGEKVSQFGCQTLEYIHFEIRGDAGPLPELSPPSLATAEQQSFPFTNQSPITCLATCVLAECINNGSFPALRRVRIPHDPQGFIQALCKPTASALLPSDMEYLKSLSSSSNSRSSSIIGNEIETTAALNEALRDFRTDSAVEVSSRTASQDMLVPARSRLAAQARILAARKTPNMCVRVYGPNGDMSRYIPIKGHLGTTGSQIVYDLKPDTGRNLGKAKSVGEHNQWITSVEDVMELESSSSIWGSCGHRLTSGTGRSVVVLDDLT